MWINFREMIHSFYSFGCCYFYFYHIRFCSYPSIIFFFHIITDYARASVKILQEAKKKEVRVTGLKLVEALQGRGANNIKIQGWKVTMSSIVNLYLKSCFLLAWTRDVVSFLSLSKRQENGTKRCKEKSWKEMVK